MLMFGPALEAGYTGAMPTDTEAIHKRNIELTESTLDLYDPNKITVAIGTAALAQSGVRLPYALKDVDVMAPQDYIDDLRQAMGRDYMADTSRLDDIEYEPDVDMRGIYLRPNTAHPDRAMWLPFQAFSTLVDGNYAMTYEQARELAYPHSSTGRLVMYPDEVLRWKAASADEKHQKFVDGVIKQTMGRTL